VLKVEGWLKELKVEGVEGSLKGLKVERVES
jgi:hypothetical protein